MMSSQLSDLDASVLRVLHSSRSEETYLTPAVIAAALGVSPALASSALQRLRIRGLVVEDDGSGWQRFARTDASDQALESTP